MSISQIGASRFQVPAFDRNAQKAHAEPPSLAKQSQPVMKKYNGAPWNHYVGAHSQVSVQEFRKTFEGYDNSAAVERFLSKQPEPRPGNEITTSDIEGRDRVFTEPGEMALHQPSSPSSREVTAGIDRWLEGEGVFDIRFLSGLSSDRFQPFADDTIRDLINRSKMSYGLDLPLDEANRIRQDAREQLASLKPSDFSWSDHSGLQALTLEERATFHDTLQSAFDKAGIAVDAKSLRYTFRTGTAILDQVEDHNLDTDTVNRIQGLINRYEGIRNEDRSLIDTIRELGKKNSEYRNIWIEA